jgi:hypothetical protein
MRKIRDGIGLWLWWMLRFDGASLGIGIFGGAIVAVKRVGGCGLRFGVLDTVGGGSIQRQGPDFNLI